jgi:sorting nexin-4
MGAINSLIDNDPTVTRRNNISKTKERIIQLESQEKALSNEFELFNNELRDDLNNFQAEKMKDIKNILLNYAKANRDYLENCEKFWRDAEHLSG